MDSQFANYKPPQTQAKSGTSSSPEIIEERKLDNHHQKMMND